jgi:hypothetical protein
MANNANKNSKTVWELALRGTLSLHTILHALCPSRSLCPLSARVCVWLYTYVLRVCVCVCVCVRPGNAGASCCVCVCVHLGILACVLCACVTDMAPWARRVRMRMRASWRSCVCAVCVCALVCAYSRACTGVLCVPNVYLLCT